MGERDVTGLRVDLDLNVDLPVEQVWSLVTDVSRIGDWSPECEYAGWADGIDGEPAVGARFEGRNRFENGQVATVTCVVTGADRPRTFSWVVLDASGDPDRPGSIWRYDLTPGESPGHTRVRHSFVHGPGDSGVRAWWRTDPDQAAALIEGRRAQLHRHMTQTVRAMERDGLRIRT